MKGFSNKWIQLSSLQWIVSRLRLSAFPGRSGQRLRFILNLHPRFLYSELPCNVIVREQSSKAGNSVDAPDLSLSLGSKRPLYYRFLFRKIRGIARDDDFEPVECWTGFSIGFQSLDGCLVFYELNRGIAAVGPCRFANGSHATTTAGTEDNVPDSLILIPQKGFE